MSEHAPSSVLPPEAAPGTARLNPAAMPLADAARVLTRMCGRPIDEDRLRADIDVGAPTNPDGSVNLVHYAAWLVREMGAGGAGAD